MWNSKIFIEAKWYWSKVLTVRHLVWWETEIEIVSWAVLFFDNFANRFKAYLWIWYSWDEKEDIKEISDWGKKLSKSEALGIFWNKSFQWWNIQEDYFLN